MKNRNITLRMAVPDDAKALVAVYAPYVLNTAVTYEYEVPSADEFRQRIAHTLENYPYVVAEVDGEIAGYAYTGRLGVRAAFAWAAETSIYLREDCHGLGIGTMLYEALERFSAAQHIVTLHSAIAWSDDADDPWLTRGSPAFHRHLGFTETAHFRHCGYKFDCWYDLLWMEKTLGTLPEKPKPFRPLPALTPEECRACLDRK